MLVTRWKSFARYLDSLHWSFGDFGGLIQVANRRGPRATRSAPQATEWHAREVPVCPPGEVQGGGPGEGLFLADHSLLAPMIITLRERRLTSGFDHFVPIILRDGSFMMVSLTVRISRRNRRSFLMRRSWHHAGDPRRPRRLYSNLVENPERR
jgi:hypothetical protein